MRLLTIPLLAALLAAGCGVEVVTVAATQAELQKQAATAATRQLEHAERDTAQARIQNAIMTYQAENGAYPPSLDALVPGYLPAIPPKPDGTPYGYDPRTGRVLDRPMTGPNPADLQKIEEIRAAIHRYGTATGYYPPTLDALAPVYLPTPPRTADGRPFVYNNQNGYVGLPDAPAPASASPVAPPVGGAGPMGEVMTGIGMQQQLNSGSAAATHAAGAQSRRTLGNAMSGYNQQAEQALGWGNQ